MQREEKCWKERNAQRNSLCCEDQVDITRSNTWGRPYQSVDFVLCWVLGLLVRKAQHQASDSVPPEVAAGTPVSPRVLVRMEGHFTAWSPVEAPVPEWATPVRMTSTLLLCDISLVQFSHSVVSDSLRPHELQHTRPSCITNSRSLLKLMSIESVMPSNHLILCLQSFPASGSFQMSQLFSSGGQSTGVWASASVLAMNIQDWSPLGWTGWISLQSKRFSRVFSNITIQKHQFFYAQLSL